MRVAAPARVWGEKEVRCVSCNKLYGFNERIKGTFLRCDEDRELSIGLNSTDARRCAGQGPAPLRLEYSAGHNSDAMCNGARQGVQLADFTLRNFPTLSPLRQVRRAAPGSAAAIASIQRARHAASRQDMPQLTHVERASNPSQRPSLSVP